MARFLPPNVYKRDVKGGSVTLVVARNVVLGNHFSQLGHSRRHVNSSMEMKAALAANAAHRRSMQHEERACAVQRDLLERRRGEADERWRGAEEEVLVGSESGSPFLHYYHGVFLLYFPAALSYILTRSPPAEALHGYSKAIREAEAGLSSSDRMGPRG